MKAELSFREKRLQALEARRKARASEAGPSYHLTVPDDVQAYLKANDLTARWLNDDERGRIYDKTQRDTWDFLTHAEVSGDARNVDDTDRISRRVGAKADGTPLLTYLCVKPKKWFDEDAKKRRRPHDEMMASIRNRPLKTAREADLSDDTEHAYIPREVLSRAKRVNAAQEHTEN